MSVRTLLALIALVTTLAIGAGSVAHAEPSEQRARVLDHTYACAVFFRGGVYLVDAHAHAGTHSRAKWARLPYAGVRSGVFSGGTGNLLAWITAGEPVAATMVDQDYDTFSARTFGTVGVRREGCKATNASVPLTSAGLKGGPVTQLGTKTKCFTPKQVLLRVRAVLAGSGELRAGRDYSTTHLAVQSAKLAVRLPSGKPLVYADVLGSGRTRLFAASGCAEQ
jgi:hypothetical protein